MGSSSSSNMKSPKLVNGSAKELEGGRPSMPVCIAHSEQCLLSALSSSPHGTDNLFATESNLLESEAAACVRHAHCLFVALVLLLLLAICASVTMHSC